MASTDKTGWACKELCVNGPRLGFWQSFFKKNREAAHCSFPILDWPCPLFSDVVQSEIKQLEHCLIIRKRTTGFGHLPKRHV